MRWLLLQDAVKHGAATIELDTPAGAHETRHVDLAGLSKEDLDRDFLGKLGLRPFRPNAPARLGHVLPGSAAQRAGLAEGDLVGADRLQRHRRDELLVSAISAW